MGKTERFWSGFLQQDPQKNSSGWLEYQLENIRLGFLLNDFGSRFQGCNAAIMFEYEEDIFPEALERAKNLGAAVVEDNLGNPALRSMILSGPEGHEFEIGIKGTHH